jgi:hypothetical protein
MSKRIVPARAAICLTFISNETYNLTTMCVGISIMGLFMVTAGLASVYIVTAFAPKLSLQNKIKAMKTKMKELMLAHNNQVIS